jgi:uncharacterized membrane protein
VSDLIVIGYPGETNAQRAWDEPTGASGISFGRGMSAIPAIARNAAHRKVLEAMRPYGGTVLQTSLDCNADQQLMRILHEEVAAPTWEQPALPVQ